MKRLFSVIALAVLSSACAAGIPQPSWTNHNRIAGSQEMMTNFKPWAEGVESATAETKRIVYSWETFLDGSNVVFEITNYISGAYNLDAAKLKIRELRDGTYREVYNSRDEILMHIENFSNLYVRVAMDELVEAVAGMLENKADRNWGKYTSAGGEAPSNTVYMTAQHTVFAGGMEYERVAVGEGSVCILTTKGAPVWTEGDEGTFRFQDDGGTNYFGFSKTDSYVIGANADNINVIGDVVELEYDITMSGVPCIWYKERLDDGLDWVQLNASDGSPCPGAPKVVSWEETPPAGAEICYINCEEAFGFFKATVEVPGYSKFETNMKADFHAGVLCTDGTTVIYPHADGSWSRTK